MDDPDRCPAVFVPASLPCLRDAGHDGMHRWTRDDDDGRGRQTVEWSDSVYRLFRP